jgi:type VI secretion system protein ImpH
MSPHEAEGGAPASAPRQAFLTELAEAPFEYDFHEAMRRLEALFRDRPRFGEALRPSEEGVRVAQPADTSFAGSAVVGFVPPEGDRPAALDISFFGLLGPQGPLPLHITDYVRDRLRHYGDRTLSAFLNLFQHRMSLLFHRAWANAQPTSQEDRRKDNRFDVYLGALLGIVAPSARGPLPRRALLQYAGWLSTPVRNPDGLRAILSDFFELPFSIDEFQGEWLEIAASSRMRLGSTAEESALGRTTILGRRLYRGDHRFRVRVGPLALGDFLRLLPGTPSFQRLTALVRTYVGDDLSWDLLLELERSANTQIRLGGQNSLGYSTSLGRSGALADLLIDPLTHRTRRTRAKR